MDFKKQSVMLKKTLGFKYEPVAVSFTNNEIENGDKKKIAICKALKLASQGDIIVVDKETSTCPGGSMYCGFSEPISGEKKKRLQWFLTEGEKLFNSLVTFERMRKLTSPIPTGLADYLVMSPLEKATIKPDLIIFLCNPEQACRLITLDTFFDGIPPKQEIIGALCHTTISYSVVTGFTNISMGDWTARRIQKFESETLFFTLPYERVENLIKAIPKCSAGEAALVIPKEFQHD
ncbi:MAG: DUF169 domain-containing protein [Methanobacteriaceae archaeon]